MNRKGNAFLQAGSGCIGDSGLVGRGLFSRCENARLSNAANPGLLSGKGRGWRAAALFLLTLSVAWAGRSSAASTPYDGYNLLQTLDSTTAWLMDNDGGIVHTWATDYRPGNSMYLLEDGDLLRTGNVNNGYFGIGGAGGIVQRIDWNGNVTWEYEYSSSSHLQHHDVELLPDGNILMIAWQYKSQSEAIAAGRDPSTLSDGELWPDSIIEIEPSGTNSGSIVWEWHAWDHLVQDYDASKANYGVVAEHPERIDLNYAMNGKADWQHVNSVDYNPELDQIILSVHNFSEIWVIDHSTTTAQAASHSGGNSGKGGDLLYRWGNPQAYGAGTANDQKLFVQHDAEWIESGLPNAGNILIFNNGGGRSDGNYSSVEEIAPPVDANGDYILNAGSAYGPDTVAWNYTAATPTDFYGQNISGQQRLPNGNTLICEGPDGYLFEVTDAGETVWSYNAGGAVFRVERYAAAYPGFDDTPLDGPDNQASGADTGATTTQDGSATSNSSSVTTNAACPDGSDVTISGYTYQSGETVDCSGKTSITAGPNVVISSAANVTFGASQSITLVSGFQVSAGGSFHAVIGSGQAPVANAGGPYSGAIGAAIALDGSGSSDADGSIVSYAWDLDNDGQYDDASGTAPSFTSSSAGTFTITLLVTDGDGLSDTHSANVVVSASTASQTYPVVDTAQDTCYSSSGVKQTCSGVGYDADYTGNAPSYTLLNGGTIVSDEVTGLYWTQTPDLNGDNSVDANDKRTLPDAESYCASLNLGGHTWRLPDIKTLYSLMDFRGTDPSSAQDGASTLTPYTDSTYFEPAFGDTAAGNRIIDGQFATATRYVSPLGSINGANTMFGVNFVDGRIKGYPYDQPANDPKTYYVRCVAGNTDYGVNALSDNLDGAISDAATGLMWEQADTSGLNFEEAVAHCESAITAGHADWRLPDAKELHSILDYSRAPDYTASAAIDPLFDSTSFINEEGETDWGYYWTSTTHLKSSGIGNSGVYIAFGRALGYFNNQVVDVHGAGAQRSDDKTNVAATGGIQTANVGYGDFYYFGPQGDISRQGNMVRCVRDGG